MICTAELIQDSSVIRGLQYLLTLQGCCLDMFITIHTTLQIVKCFHQENVPFNQRSRTWFQPFSPPPSTPIHFLDLILEEMRQPRTVCIFLSLQTMLCCYIPSRSAALKTCLQRPKNRVAKALLPPSPQPIGWKGVRTVTGRGIYNTKVT